MTFSLRLTTWEMEEYALRFTRLILFVLLLLLIPSALFAAPTAVMTVPAEGDHFYWFTYKGVDNAPITTAPRRFKDKTVTLEFPLVKDAVAQSTLYVYDAKTGNEAVYPVKAKSADSTKIDLKSADFSSVRRLGVAVSSSANQEKAAAAVVVLQSGRISQTQVVDPTSSGTVYFTDVPTGAAKVTVSYGAGKSSTQDIDVPLDRQDTVPVIQVPVVGDIETIQPAQTSTEEGASPRSGAGGTSSREVAPTPRGSGYSYGTAFFGLILLAGLIWAAYRVLMNKGVAVKSLLKRAGIDLPEEKRQTSAASAPQQIVVDPSVCPFCGGKKDPITGGCACSVAPGASASSPMPGIVTEPRLVASAGPYAGSIYALGSGTVSIGRDESNVIAFPLDTAVSRRHSRIENTGAGFTVYDEGSSNGTFVNGMKVTDRALRPGDEIQVGGTRLRFEA